MCVCVREREREREREKERERERESLLLYINYVLAVVWLILFCVSSYFSVGWSVVCVCDVYKYLKEKTNF